uniref:Uncharacterized protein LOC105142253 n=1 Tax=Rhizophora mucronata TaxID=61149 RepID=A0A2P2NJJ3_RHIMU
MDQNSTRNETTESESSKNSVKDIPKPIASSPRNNIQVSMVDLRGGNDPINVDTSEVNMEASMTTGDVMRAGGFGARDDISSILPVASDSTDFEATILDARNYEEPQGEVDRHGLGWTEGAEKTIVDARNCEQPQGEIHQQGLGWNEGAEKR